MARVSGVYRIKRYTLIGYHSDTQGLYTRVTIARSATEAIQAGTRDVHGDARAAVVLVAVLRGNVRNELGVDSPRPLTYWDNLSRGGSI